jgi:hypothetical protein
MTTATHDPDTRLGLDQGGFQELLLEGVSRCLRPVGVPTLHTSAEGAKTRLRNDDLNRSRRLQFDKQISNCKLFWASLPGSRYMSNWRLERSPNRSSYIRIASPNDVSIF